MCTQVGGTCSYHRYFSGTFSWEKTHSQSSESSTSRYVGSITATIDSGRVTCQGSTTYTSKSISGPDSYVETRREGRTSGPGVLVLDLARGMVAAGGRYRIRISCPAETVTETKTRNSSGNVYTETKVREGRPGSEHRLADWAEGVTESWVRIQGSKAQPPSEDNPENLVLKWDLWSRSQKLAANAGGPYRVERAAIVTLDGTRSTGRITSYTWTFAPVGSGQALGAAPKSGATAPVQVLETIDATLTVSDGSAEDQQTVRVTVVPRVWKTSFEHIPDEGQITDNTPTVKTVRAPDGSQSFVGQLTAGENVAADDNSAAGDHIFSPKATNGSWATGGYELAQVKDGGPFHGTWYVDAYGLRIKRRTLINKHLLPSGPAFSGFKGKSLYQFNKDLGNGIDGYLAAVRAHEGLGNARGVLGHSGLMRKALPTADPAAAVERSIGADSAAVVGKADEAIRKAEITLCEKSADPLPQTWSGKLAFPRDDYTGYEVATVAVGGTNEIYRSMASCAASRTGMR